MRRVCIFLLQLGGPADIAGIEPFLRNLFEDVLPLPGLLRGPLARRLAKKRAPFVAPQYQQLGGGSPILRHTEAQASALRDELARRGIDSAVLTTMRYAPPRAETQLLTARRDWSDAAWVALPLYPQYSFATTRSSLDELMGQLAVAEQERLLQIRSYADDPHYLDAMAECVRAALERAPASATLLFSAHGLPVKLVKDGDPYPQQIDKTVAGILERLPGMPHRLAYQSRVGRARWLEPSLLDSVAQLGREGCRAVVVVPVSFVSEHIETLIELDVEVAHAAKQAGIESYIRAETPMTRPTFIRALAEQVTRVL